MGVYIYLSMYVHMFVCIYLCMYLCIYVGVSVVTSPGHEFSNALGQYHRIMTVGIIFNLYHLYKLLMRCIPYIYQHFSTGAVLPPVGVQRTSGGSIEPRQQGRVVLEWKWWVFISHKRPQYF